MNTNIYTNRWIVGEIPNHRLMVVYNILLTDGLSAMTDFYRPMCDANVVLWYSAITCPLCEYPLGAQGSTSVLFLEDPALARVMNLKR